MIEKNNKYSIRNILLLIFIYSIAYYYCIVYAPTIENNKDDSWVTKLSNMNKSCLVNCKTKECETHIKNSRGNTYLISLPKEEQGYLKKCLITFWGFSHFLLYFVLAFFVPKLYIEEFIIGILFEIWEYYKFDCHDMNDIVLNGIGILLGRYLSPYK